MKGETKSKPRVRYITPEGQQALKDELNYIWKVQRPEVTRKVTEAAAMGDRSENAEYIYGKRQLRQIDSRVCVLRQRLEELVVVKRRPEDESRSIRRVDHGGGRYGRNPLPRLSRPAASSFHRSSGCRDLYRIATSTCARAG